MQRYDRPTALPLPAEAIDAFPDDAVVGRESHENAPAVIVRADRVRSVLSTLRSRAGFDHCSCVTA